MPTKSENTSEGESEQKKQKGDPELASLVHDRKEGTGSSSLPDLMQRGIHRLGCEEEDKVGIFVR